MVHLLTLHEKFADRLWNSKSLSQTATKLSATGFIANCLFGHHIY